MTRFAIGVALALSLPVHAAELDALKQKVQAVNDAEAEDAAQKLAASSDPKALDAMLDVLAQGGSPKVAVALLAGLQGKKEPRVAQVLEHYAKNRSVDVRKKALAVLGELQGDRAVPTLRFLA
jgi:hypothetical protein